jgi:hypothetical protein
MSARSCALCKHDDVSLAAFAACVRDLYLGCHPSLALAFASTGILSNMPR